MAAKQRKTMITVRGKRAIFGTRLRTGKGWRLVRDSAPAF